MLRFKHLTTQEKESISKENRKAEKEKLERLAFFQNTPDISGDKEKVGVLNGLLNNYLDNYFDFSIDGFKIFFNDLTDEQKKFLINEAYFSCSDKLPRINDLTMEMTQYLMEKRALYDSDKSADQTYSSFAGIGVAMSTGAVLNLVDDKTKIDVPDDFMLGVPIAFCIITTLLVYYKKRNPKNSLK